MVYALFLLLTVLLPAHAMAAVNLHPNPDLATAQGWQLLGATHSAGALQLTRNDRAIGPAIPITAGTTYSCGVYIRGSHAPTDFMRLSLALYDGNGTHLYNAPGASDWAYAQKHVWQETVIIHHATGKERQMRFLLSRAIALAGETPVEVDNVYCRPGVQFNQAPSAKKPFQGGRVQVDTTGRVTIRQPNGTWKPEFLRCMFSVNTEDWTHYSKNGWNCNMWVASLAGIEKSVKAGMPYNFFQLGQYIHKGAWAYGNLTALRADLGAILKSSYAHNLVGYYYDNESPDQFVLAQQVLAVVKELDTVNGQRQRPIYILQGNPGRQLAYTGMAELTGGYHFGASSTQLTVLEQVYGQTTPVGFGQIQQEPGKTADRMRHQVLSAIEDGATAIGYWHTRPIVQELWYPAFPAIIKEALAALGL